MRPACQLVADILNQVSKMVKPGLTTKDIDDYIESRFQAVKAVPLFKGYPGKTPFPAVTCISVNDEVVHGIPSAKRVLQEGDIVSVDTGCNLNGWCGDSAISIGVGKISAEKQKLLDVCNATLDLAIRELSQQRKWSQIALRMQEFVHGHGYSVVEQFVGHGIGRTMHEEPQVPNYVARAWMKHDFWIDPGLVIAIEPMVNLGAKRVKVKSDNWTVETADHLPSAHVEHTVAVTTHGIEVLTSREGMT